MSRNGVYGNCTGVICSSLLAVVLIVASSGLFSRLVF